MRHTVREHHHKLIECRLPSFQRYRPFFRGVLDGQIDHLQRRIVIRKQFSLIGRFEDDAVNEYDGVGGINDLSDLAWRIGKSVHLSAPGSADCMDTAGPIAHKGSQFLFNLRNGNGLENFLEPLGGCFTVFPGDEV